MHHIHKFGQINGTHINQMKHLKTHQETNVKKTSRGVDFPTKVPGKGVRVKLASYEFCGAEDDSQTSQSHAHLSISGGQFIQRFGLKQLWLFRPIQGEAI